jgi:dephospho-CoA kinase
VFADKNLLAKLNAIVHPAVKQDIIIKFRSLGVIAEPMNSDSGLFFIECAILFQAGFDVLCDKVVAVTAPEDIRLERVIARDHSDMNKVRARMRAQEAEKDLARADIVINNDGTTPIPSLCEKIILQLKKEQR